MTRLQQRIFIFLDEWLGILLLAWLHYTKSDLFWEVFVVWALMIYVISYPSYWLRPWLDLAKNDEDDELESGDLG